MKYVFGPVPSRRLGQSLGIDTIPLKTCNWNCVYCQLGRTRPVVNERKAYYPREEILSEAAAGLAEHEPREIDWVTFVGSGEPTLHTDIGWLIRQVKALTAIPVAVITNGALLYLPEVRQALSAADAVLPSLDAGCADLYRRVNRPHPQVNFKRYLEGMVAFRSEYRGKLWVEVMLMLGVNDSQEALGEIAAALHRVRPDEVHIGLPTRPPAETWVQPADERGILRARRALGAVARVIQPSTGRFDLGGYTNISDALLAIIGRHPMRQEEVERALAEWAPDQIVLALTELENSGKAQVVERHGESFWSAAPAYFPD